MPLIDLDSAAKILGDALIIAENRMMTRLADEIVAPIRDGKKLKVTVTVELVDKEPK